jgi:hypothetical protein
MPETLLLPKLGYKKMKHKEKVKLARKLLTRKELQKKTKVSKFQSKNWEYRKNAIANRKKK